MYLVITPQSQEEFVQYYQFRWQYLRAPWQQPVGSEKDDLETHSAHRMIVDEQGEVIAVGRIHKVSQSRAQIRYMAVADSARGKGLGRLIIQALELQACIEGVNEVELNAREVALQFYVNLGYQEQEKTHLLFGEIQHYLMTKAMPSLAKHEKNLASELTSTWHNTIPMSKAMNMQVSHFDGENMVTTCDLAFNKNLHNTMFAGSIYTLATLSGWGWVYFMLKQANLTGDIVLADANIKYLKPVAGAASGNVKQADVSGSLTNLTKGKRAKLTVKVAIKCGDLCAALFEGKYAILPVIHNDK